MMNNTENLSAATTSTSSLVSIDPSDPLYVHHSDIPGIPLVSTMFNGSGYSGWRRNILMALSGRNKIAFINGSCPKPSEDSPLYRQWERCNDIVTSWILNSMTKEMADSVVCCNSAKEVWDDIEERFGGVNGARILELKKQLAFASQGSLDIASYYTKIKSIWDELNLVSTKHSIKCTCGAQAEFKKAQEDEKLYQFLMGLNETYVGVRSNIMMMSPLPTVGNAYNILISDEQQRQMQPSGSFTPEAVSFIAGNFPQKPSQKSYSQRTNYNNKRYVECQYCFKPGHTVET